MQQRLSQSWPAQSPVATTAQLADAGLGQRTLASALKRGLVCRLRKGAYVRSAYWRELKPWDQDSIRLLAHLVSARGDPVYSYFSAARLHGLFIWNCGPLVHVTGHSAASGTSGARDVVAHHEELAVGDSQTIKLRNGRAVLGTTLERTVVDCARLGNFVQAVVIGDHALRNGARLEAMWAMVNAIPGRRGVRKARRVLRALDERSESPGETRTRLIIADMGIEQPALQLELHVAGRVYRPDFAWVDRKVIVEFDGDQKYFAYRPTAEALLEERKRERRLMEDGWRFVRLEWRDLSHPEDVKRRILSVLNAPFFAAAA
ncbi:MAG: type IV toxin-antitoxin system AbiEi family antitoxin domain-containing protein [Specibacter sp.]